MSAYPQIMLLNGTSSSGKSSIVRERQERIDTLYLNISIDTILYALPPSDLQAMIGGMFISRHEYSYDKLVDGFHAAIKALADTGLRLIVDNAITNDKWRSDIYRAFDGHEAVIIGVYCDIEVAKAREIARKDRAIGTVDWEFARVHTNMKYDFAVDTSNKTSQECAAAIVRFFEQDGEDRTTF